MAGCTATTATSSANKQELVFLSNLELFERKLPLAAHMAEFIINSRAFGTLFEAIIRPKDS